MNADSLEMFAAAIVVEEGRVERTKAALAAAEASQGNIARRIASLQSERAATIARRTAGDIQPEDGATLALAMADSEGLAGLLPNADAALAAARANHHAAISALSAARVAYAAEEKRIEIAALDSHADRLIGLLNATMRHRHEAARGMSPGGRDFHALTEKLQALDGIMAEVLGELRSGVPFHNIVYGRHPLWTPSEALYANVWRLYNSAGRFAG